MCVYGHEIYCSVRSRAPSPMALVQDRLRYQAPRPRVDRPRRPEILVLHHPNKREVPDGIDPKPRARDAEPAERAVQDRITRGRGIRHDLKVHAPAGARRHLKPAGVKLGNRMGQLAGTEALVCHLAQNGGRRREGCSGADAAFESKCQQPWISISSSCLSRNVE
jgi:hypothetical protein